MTEPLPGTRKDWQARIKKQKIPLELLSSGHAFKSGSLFSEEDFLRLQILHQISHARELYRTELSKTSVTRISKVFDHNGEIRALRQLLLRERINTWTDKESESTPRFDAALQLLKTISTSPSFDESEEESSDDTIPSRIINSPRIRRAPDRYGQANPDVSDDFSNLSLGPRTPPNKSDRFSAASGPVLFTPASVSTMASPKNPDLQAAHDLYQREKFQRGHEPAVNNCLVVLIINAAATLKANDRVRCDRKCFQVLKKHANDDKALYQAQVDGLILEQNRKDIQAFMEAKRDLRGVKKDVRMQEGAEMAAFVYSKGRTTDAKRYDKVLHLSLSLSLSLRKLKYNI